ncbi:MAG: excinuclease ABC subunit A [Candidatus Magasanikbacteria bacterium RIFOXYD2_FULL_41_14]|uniref:UvrABC system protein A n=1 Tax=Candidatus Magasanikbacteria bacterium RIFOXYD2_FULL_41_14 TaxID=1798709 RepID=A0A1F6PCA5_9BACT|nr:MAG: excinuclease ABC subunit A [Candidatus Magasanikbacteria bacterium RIFOXYD2_FULL_41_14]
MPDFIVIKGARVHNLKNVSIKIPKNKLVVVTGLSGSGKSSLAFDTVYAEGQRRYAESLSSYARQFMGVRDKPDVNKIDGLSPTIAIDQKVFAQNPRSTVGTATEIYDYLRLLFSSVGQQYCPDCNLPTKAYTPGEIAAAVRRLARNGRVVILAPLVDSEEVDKKILLERVERSGFEEVEVNGVVMKCRDFADYNFSVGRRYCVAIVVGRIEDIKKQNPTVAVESALDLGNGVIEVVGGKEKLIFSTSGLCPRCGNVYPLLQVRNFSFNSPYGACPRCTGLGVTMEVDLALVVPNTRLTLSQGAIQPWTRITGNQAWYQKLLAVVAEVNNFSLDVSFVDLPEKVRQLVMEGTGTRLYDVDGKKTTFSGVRRDLLSRHLETTSDYVRREIEQYMRELTCPECAGQRLRRESLAVKIGGYSIAELSSLSIEQAIVEISKLKIEHLAVFSTLRQELLARLNNLQKVGLGYLSLDRSLTTLSGGEVTRVRLGSQLSSGLTGVIYILDEPSVGLHPRDNQQLISTLRYLRDLGNSVIVVEHDTAMMKAADYLIDVGPGAGVYGGEIVAQGTYSQVVKSAASLTGQYLIGKEKVINKPAPRPCAKNCPKLTVAGAKAFNLKNVTVDFPLQRLVCVTGVSGSGKSSLVLNILSRALLKKFYRAKDEPGEHKEIKGVQHIDKVIAIDQSPIGRTPRSNPATYTGIFVLIRDLFASLPESRLRGYDAGKFSFNVKGGGRCEACSGDGYIRIPMQFLADVFMECAECSGARYNQEAMEIHYKEKNIADVLNMTAEEAFKFFVDLPSLADKLDLLRAVGLGYVKLGQSATTLSGGEAQRIKLATELSRASTGRTLYILDEPTTGLHFEDVKHLLVVLEKLVDKGNSVLVIEHNTDVIKAADWVVELGPEGGEKGGYVLASGTPADIKKNKKSWTGKYL